MDSGKLHKINVTYVSPRSGATQTATELVTANKLLEFFEKCKSALPHSGRAEIDRVTKRMPSMKNAKFPYKNVREGQRDFIKAAYRIIAKGAELLATAPTGTGKTVSALFPAVRAIGEGKCNKAFYLTPKATTAAAAKEAIEKMVESGAQIRAVTLTAKEKLCRNGLLCIDGR
jgi:replicative superfamily II helicase